MSSLVDKIFGGTDKSALKSQKKENLELRGIIGEGAAGARQDVLDLFPSAEGARTAGFQGALDVFGQTIPQQAAAFTGGNVAAQQALLAAILMRLKRTSAGRVSAGDEVITVDDTVGGIGEAINGGCWAVGVSRYSNYMNIDSLEHEQQLTPTVSITFRKV